MLPSVLCVFLRVFRVCWFFVSWRVMQGFGGVVFADISDPKFLSLKGVLPPGIYVT